MLTGLPNSEYLMEYLDDIIKIPGISNKAVVLLSCTNFKVLNMTYGFLYGNEILKQIALKVRYLLKPEDMLFRFEGDRFIIVLDNYKDHEKLKEWGHKLGDVFENPFSGSPDHQYINAEIGIVEMKDKNTSVDKIFQNAAMALSYFNGESKNQIMFFNDAMKKDVLRKDQIAKVLRTVIEGKDTESFYLVFQPKLDIKKDQIIGFEALARLYTKDLGQISPYEFIAVAEDWLQIYDLGNRIYPMP